ncbi:MAG: hypothetical protein J6K15_06170 [Lachnospiraceae bacterium]|nr:hypothetical protein [Lachnospiraceae bacterium]
MGYAKESFNLQEKEITWKHKPTPELAKALKYLPEGKTHITEEQFSDRDLAACVNAFFLTESDKNVGMSEEEKGELYWYKKEVAYQVIRRLIGNGERIPAVIQTEEDWKRYFLLENRGDS